MTDQHDEVPEHFPTIEAGEWVRVPEDGRFLFKCCDCGLVHHLQFEVVDGRVTFAAWRETSARCICGHVQGEHEDGGVSVGGGGGACAIDNCPCGYYDWDGLPQ